MLLIQYEKCQNMIYFEENTRFTWEFVLFLKFCRDIDLWKTHNKYMYFANCFKQVTLTMVDVKVVIRITYWRCSI